MSSSPQLSTRPENVNPASTAPQRTAGKVKEWSFPLSFQRNIDAIVTIHGENLKRRDLEILEKKVRDLIDAWEDESETPKDE